MKKFTTLVLAMALGAPFAFSAPFEGKITMAMSGHGAPAQPMTFSLKNGLSRIDVSTGKGQTAGMIFDQAKQEMTILMPEQKMYMVQPVPKPGETPGAPTPPSDTTVEKTGDHEKILGYDCVKYLAKGKEGTSEIWITEQLGTFMGLGSGGNPMGGGRRGRGSDANQAWENAFRGKEAFPLRVVTKSADGKENFRMEATAIDKTALPDSLFAPPADYQKFDMGNMMRGMGMPGMRPPGNG